MSIWQLFSLKKRKLFTPFKSYPHFVCVIQFAQKSWMICCSPVLSSGFVRIDCRFSMGLRLKTCCVRSTSHTRLGCLVNVERDFCLCILTQLKIVYVSIMLFGWVPKKEISLALLFYLFYINN